jgi:DNA helicase-2/ATP-dependent DNA helicase PcrA
VTTTPTTTAAPKAGRLRPSADGEYLKSVLGQDFTAEQLAIITAPLRPQLVIAGAGSGKTMVMAARVVHAVAHHGLPPSRVLGLTFTNKAAGELADRVRRSLAQLASAGANTGGTIDLRGGSLRGGDEWPRARDDDVDLEITAERVVDEVPTVATYHAYAGQIVRDHALRIGREPGATLLTEAVQWQLAMRVATRAPGPFTQLNWTTSYVADLIVALAGDLADHLASADDVRRHTARIRAEVAALAKPLRPAKDMVDRAIARDELLSLVSAYTAEKQRLEVIDFGDQVALACAIAAASPAVVAAERARFSLVVLDEYQDTGVAQRVLLSQLFAGSAITAVGDPNQAIYGWRGASASNLLRFGEHFGAATVDAQPLMTSFRCDGRVLAAANAVAGQLSASAAAKGRMHLEIPRLSAVATAQSAGRVLAARHATAVDEAQWLARRIAASIAGGHPAGEVAVLARRRADFARLHQAMIEERIPVEVVGLGGLLAMPEVSDIVAVLSLLADPTANAEAIRLLSGPRWRLGVRDLAALGDRAAYLARDRPPATDGADEPAVSGRLDQALRTATGSVDPVEVPSLLEAAESPGPSSRCSPAALERLAAFAAELRVLRTLVGQPLVDLVSEVVATTGIDIEIEAGEPVLARARLANVQAFLDVAGGFTGIDGDADLIAFLAYLRAARENEDGLDVAAVSSADTVKLMTIHAAKGLEWDLVAIPGLVEMVFPSGRGRSSWLTGAQVLPFECRGDAADLPVLRGYETADFTRFKDECRSDADDEERRLAYVAMTRARHELWLSSYVWSATRRDPCATSRFLSEVMSLGDGVVTVDTWSDDVVGEGVPNPLLDIATADVAWPADLEPGDLRRREAAAELVERAIAVAAGRDAADSGAAVDAADDQLALPLDSTRASEPAAVDQWRRDSALLLAERRQRRSRSVDVAVPARLTTSQVVALARDSDEFAASLARPLPTRPYPQARRGSRFHRWVEELYAAAPLLEPDDLPGAGDADLDDEELATLQERFVADGWAERRPVAVEAPFEMTVGGRLVRGRIDAVYADGAGGFDVIDFKTGAVPTGAEFDAVSYQLSIYRLAWADLAGVDPAGVQAGFLYVRYGLLKRPERLMDRHELDRLLTA